jgi:hypothetical protein
MPDSSFSKRDPVLLPTPEWLIEPRSSQDYNRHSIEVTIPIDLDTSFYKNKIPSGTLVSAAGVILTAEQMGSAYGLLVDDIVDKAGESYKDSKQLVAVIAKARVVIVLDKLPEKDIWGNSINTEARTTVLQSLGFFVQLTTSVSV